jgi:ornithine carbamoyltransferase
VIVARTYRHRHVSELAAHASVPVINGLSDLLHPCQALADLFTLHEKWGPDLPGKKFVYVGDGNNTCHSLLHAAPKLGLNVTVATPQGYEPNFKVMESARAAASEHGVTLEHTSNPQQAVTGAHAVYTDVWASMGQEDETEERAAVFHDFQVNEALMAEAQDDAFFMHCLPAHRGQEVTAAVLDGPNSIVFDIAENRLHAQKAVLALLLSSAIQADAKQQLTTGANA